MNDPKETGRMKQVKEDSSKFCISLCLLTYLTKLFNYSKSTQSAFTCSKLTIEILEQGVKYVQI